MDTQFTPSVQRHCHRMPRFSSPSSPTKENVANYRSLSEAFSVQTAVVCLGGSDFDRKSSFNERALFQNRKMAKLSALIRDADQLTISRRSGSLTCQEGKHELHYREHAADQHYS